MLMNECHDYIKLQYDYYRLRLYIQDNHRDTEYNDNYINMHLINELLMHNHHGANQGWHFLEYQFL